MRRLEDEGREADKQSEIISVSGLLSIVAGCEAEGVFFKEFFGRASLVWRQTLFWPRLVYRNLNFQTSN